MTTPCQCVRQVGEVLGSMKQDACNETCAIDLGPQHGQLIRPRLEGTTVAVGRHPAGQVLVPLVGHDFPACRHLAFDPS